MCEKRSSRRVRINGKIVRVDACIAGLIRSLNEHGIETLACCCGHGKYPMTIVYRHKSRDCLNGNIYDFCSGWGIPRTRRFYLTDAEGLYYIPEVEEEEG